MTGADNRLGEVESLAGSVLALPADIPHYTALARGALALLAVRRSDTAAAQELYTSLASTRGIMLHYLSADRVLGLLAETMSRFDLATAHFQDAMLFCEQAGYRPEYAWTAFEYARCLVHHGAPGDVSKADSLLQEALGIAGELGLNHLTNGIVDLQSQIAPLLQGPEPYPDGLTEREVEVLRCVAGGQSNSEIAAGLDLSVRTVERHVSNIYTKINARGRADATAYAFSSKLVS